MKIFLIGHGPLPCEKGVKCQTAFGLRTWQFLSLKQTIDAEINLILIANKNHYEATPNFYAEENITAFGKNITLTRVEKNNSQTKKIIKATYKDFNPNVCFGINLPAANLMAQLKPKIPFWADLNGWTMTEGQSQSWIEKNDGYLPFLWQQEKNVLQVADKISTVCHPQKYATYGELATIGRLNSFTDEYALVETIVNANEINTARAVVETKNKNHKINSLRQKLNLPEDTFIVFFSGAYNTWLDSETLFTGVQQAMKQSKKIHFVSTGGAAAVSNKSLDDFKRLIKDSSTKNNFHFLGWLTTTQLHEYYTQVDIAINIDRPNHETTFGARNRINEWVAFEVPLLSTIRSEVSKELNNVQGLIGIDCRDVGQLTQKIIAATDNQIDLKKLTQNAKIYADKNWSYKKTMRPVISWLNSADKSPDYQKNSNLNNASWIKKIWFHIQKDGWKNLLNKCLEKVRVNI